MTSENPLLSSCSFPAFGRIEAAHFMEAFDVRLQEARQRLATIKASAAEPSFANTVAAIEGLFSPLFGLNLLASSMVNTLGSEALRQAEQDVAQAYAAFNNEVYQDEGLAARFLAVKKTLGPNPDPDAQDAHLLQIMERAFEGAGATLTAAQKEEIRSIDARLVPLASAFMDHLQKAATADAIWITDEAMLAGIDGATLDAFAQAARDNGKDGQWMIAAERLTIDNLLGVADNRTLRQRLYEAMARQCDGGPNDNTAIAREMLALRARRAHVLGYPDYATYKMKGSMADTPQEALARMDELIPPLVQKLESEMALVGDYARANGGPATLEPWDTDYWARRYAAEHFGYSDADLAPYLEFETVLGGFLDHASTLFDISFQRSDAAYPRLHEDTRAYEVYAQGADTPMAVMLLDSFMRPETKAGGAWMDTIQLRDAGRLPVVGINMNFMRTQGRKTLLLPEDVAAIYHEGGHGLHGIFGAQARYATLRGPEGGTSDYFEIFSTVQEFFAFAPQNLARYARHHETGEPLPQALLDRMNAARTFFQAAPMLRLLQNARRDLIAHSGDAARLTDLKALEREAALDTPYAAHVRPYPYARFMHLFMAGGSPYAAGYYGYAWSELHASAAFKPFADAGLYNPAWSERLRGFYTCGSGINYNAAFETYLGHKATPERYLAQAGITYAKPATINAPRCTL